MEVTTKPKQKVSFSLDLNEEKRMDKITNIFVSLALYVIILFVTILLIPQFLTFPPSWIGYLITLIFALLGVVLLTVLLAINIGWIAIFPITLEVLAIVIAFIFPLSILAIILAAIPLWTIVVAVMILVTKDIPIELLTIKCDIVGDDVTCDGMLTTD